MSKHALLSASSAKRWLSCSPSARLCENYPDKSSSYAAEGTDAHTLGEYKLRIALGLADENGKLPQDPKENLSYYNEEMEACADGYAEYVCGVVEAAKQKSSDVIVLIEQRLDFSRYVPDGFGTGDCVVIADGTLHIIDYKHGQGVLVEAVDNPQMKLYALGALETYDFLYDIDTVSMTIFQPRRDNVSTHTVSKGSLTAWAQEVLVPTAQRAWKGEGEFVCGEWCGFCKAKAECRARAEANLELVRYDFCKPALLEDNEISEILGKLNELKAWATAVEEFAFNEALKGKKWSGYKLVEGRSNREYTDTKAVTDRLLKAGYRDIYKPAEILGLTAMTKAIGGKAKFGELLEGTVKDAKGNPTYEPLIHKPHGKPTLVPESDKRQEITVNSAADDFAE
ncbi:hypothetical protein FACS1894105_04190 [Clostridia bacterium]|nr:hypothetical protein FACS1894105_04190 [Clostridia bacterium]